MDEIEKSDAEWRDELTPEQYSVCRCSGTEPAFSGAYWDCHDTGIYRCVCCGAALFGSEDKFDSGSGWPSFQQPCAPENIVTRIDSAHGMQRIEVLCKQCGAHLGHVFPDGPPPSGLRFCINSTALALDRN
ncbi:MAG: peptide-methionine (R)-S-oxide reductase [Gallionellales bacterium GWA2_60_18]|nr:MAG: peptide-methionine (R)-S-oxide reductase [Gallionellales bacterium GWA2_60_18]